MAFQLAGPALAALEAFISVMVEKKSKGLRLMIIKAFPGSAFAKQS